MTLTALCDSIRLTVTLPPGDTARYEVVVAEFGREQTVVRILPVRSGAAMALPTLDRGALKATASVRMVGYQIPQIDGAAEVDCGGRPNVGGLPSLMWGARSLAEARELFLRDSLLYPAVHDRLLPLWWGRLKSGFDPGEVLREADALLAAVRPGSTADDPMARVARLGRASALWFEGRHDEAATELARVDGIKAPGSGLSPAMRGMLEHLTVELYEGKATVPPRTRLRMLATITDVTLRDGNLETERHVLVGMHMHSGPALESGALPLARRLLDAIDARLAQEGSPMLHAVHGDLLPVFTDMCNNVGRPDQALAVFRREYPKWRGVSGWNAGRDDRPQWIDSEESAELSMLLTAAEAHVSTGDTAAAFELGREAFERLRGAAAPPRSLAANRLATWALWLGRLRDAETYMDSAAALDNPFIAELRRGLDSARARGGLSPMPAAPTTAPEAVRFRVAATSAPQLRAAVDGGGLYCLVFTTQSCGPCSRVAPGLVDAVSRVIPDAGRVIVATPSRSEHRAWAAARCVTLTADQSVITTFGVRAYPAVMICRGDRILKRWDEFNEHTAGEVTGAIKHAMNAPSAR